MKSIFLLSLLLIVSFLSFPQNFSEKIITANVENPTSLHVADLNSDGNDDVVVSGSGGIFWYDDVVDDYNFRKAIIDTLKNIFYIDLIDFNGDTHIDIVGHSADTDEFFWLENNGSGSFTWHLISSGIADVKALKALDMENDGDVDILFTIYSGGFYETYLHENTGTGFVTSSSYLARQSTNTIFPIDYQNDGDYDLVVVKDYSPLSTDEIYIEINDGTNVFSEFLIYEKTGTITLTDVLHIDMDGNGAKDLVVADYPGKEIYWLSNTTSVRKNILTGKAPLSFEILDLNGDGVLDIAYSEYISYNSYNFNVLQGSNPGASISFSQVFSNNYPTRINNFTSLDIENDSASDIVFLVADDDMILCKKNLGGFDFDDVFLSKDLKDPKWIRRVDLNKDGYADIVSLGDDALYYLENQGNETYKTILISSNIDGPYQVEVHDMDIDGDLDIVTGSIGDDDLVVWENDGNQNFTRNAITSTPSQLSNPKHFAISDLDGDNDPDIVVSASAMDFGNPIGLYWIENFGAGNYSLPIMINDDHEFMQQVVTHDFDGDGDDDIIATNIVNGTGLRKVRNNGNGTFSESAINSSLPSEHLRKADINSDGFMDFAVRSSNNTIEWFENNGTGDFTFTQHTIDPDEDDLVLFELIDFDQDDDMDIFFFTSYSGFSNAVRFKFGLLENDGSQNFTKIVFQENLSNILTAWVEDVDGDGDTDIYLGYGAVNKIVFYENLQFTLVEPVITNWPSASAITYGEALSESNLIGGSSATPGSFAFANPAQLLPAGSHQVTVKFVPVDGSSFKTVINQVSIEVTKANPVVTQWPSAGSIVYPAALSTVVFSGGISNPAGTFEFVDPDVVPAAGTFNVDAVFTANDAANYNQLFSTISVTVNKGVPVINSNPAASTITYGQMLSESTLTGGAASTPGGTFSFSNPDDILPAGESSVDVTYTPADTDNYTTVTFSINITINKADPVVSLWPATSSITYGNTLAVSTFTGGVADISGVFSFVDTGFMPDAGNYDAEVIFQPDDDQNYNSIISEPGDVAVQVNPKSIQITANNKSKVYGEADPAFTWQITVGSMVGDDQLTGSLTRDTGEDADDYAITQGTLDAGSNYNLQFVEGILTITARPLEVTAQNGQKIYGESDPSFQFTITSGSLINGDQISGTLTREEGQNVGVYDILKGSLTAGTNYSLTFLVGSFTIVPRSLEITANPDTKIYGNADPEFTWFISDGDLVGEDAIVGSLAREIGEDVGEYAILQNTLDAGSNYETTFNQGVFEIEKRNVTVQLLDQSKTYGDPDPGFTTEIITGSLVGTDTFSGNATRIAGEDVGQYAIEAGNLTLGNNYQIQWIEGLFTIDPRDISVQADVQSKEYGDDDPEFSFTITIGSMAFDDQFTGSMIRESGEDIGNYQINQGTFTPGSNYNFSFTAGLLSITKRSIEITANNEEKIYGNTDPILTFSVTIGSLLDGDQFTGELTREPGEIVGTYPILQGTMALNENYDLTYQSAEFQIIPRPIEVAANAIDKTYGDPDPSITYTVTGELLGDDTFSGEPSREPGENVGEYQLQLGTLTLGDNYLIEFVPAVLTINARSLEVTADSKSKTYGFADPELTWNITSGLLAFDDQLTGAPGREAGENVGTYDINSGTLNGGGNYDLVFLDAMFTINPRTVTVNGNFAVENKIFDGTTDAVIMADGLVLVTAVEGDDLQLEPVARFTSADPGEDIPVELTDATILSGASKDNYILSLEGAPLAYATILPADTYVSGTDMQNVNPVVYPNPFREELNFDNIQNSRSMTLLDISGRVVLYSENIEKTIDVSQLVNGVYFIRIAQNNGTTFTHKLVKE